MIDHVSIQVRDLGKSTLFYVSALRPLELNKLVESKTRVGFGKAYPEFWLNHRPNLPMALDETGSHVCLRAPSRQAVINFHAEALDNGGRSDGAPSDREATITSCFNAFIVDVDGNRIEAVTFPR